MKRGIKHSLVFKANVNLQTSNWLRCHFFFIKSNGKERSNESLGNARRNESNVHQIEPLELLNATEEEILISFKRNFGVLEILSISINVL